MLKGGFQCLYIRTHTKEKPSKKSNITFAILPFYQKKILKMKLNGHPLLSLMKPSDVLQNGFNINKKKKKMQNLELVNIKCVTYAQPISLSSITRHLMDGWDQKVQALY